MMMMLSAGLMMLAAQAAPVPVILDTDIGDDIDDTWALCMLLGSPEVDLKLVVTASDNTPAKTRLTAKILQQIGRTDVPIGTGKQTSENRLHQDKWLGDYSLENYPGVVHEDGVQALIDTIHALDGKAVLCVIGPQTNLREALERDPSIAQKTRIVSMAGSVHKGYGGKPEPDAEWNVFKDVAAARAVFAAPWEITMAPLDSCGTLILKGGNYQKVAESKTPRAVVVMENYRHWTNRKHYPEDESSVLFDTAATYLCYDEAFLKIETIKLSIDDKGNTVLDPENGRDVRCAMDWNDREAFEAALVKSLTGE